MIRELLLEKLAWDAEQDRRAELALERAEHRCGGCGELAWDPDDRRCRLCGAVACDGCGAVCCTTDHDAEQMAGERS